MQCAVCSVQNRSSKNLMPGKALEKRCVEAGLGLLYVCIAAQMSLGIDGIIKINNIHCTCTLCIDG